MANLVSDQYQGRLLPGYHLRNGFTEVEGRVSFLYFSRNTTTGSNSTDLNGDTYEDPVANGDVIYNGILKKGTRILFGRLFREALGAGVTLKVGIVGADAQFLASFDASAAGASELAATAALGAGMVLEADSHLIITVGGADPAADKVISGFIAFAKN